MDKKEVQLLEEAVKWLKFIGRNEAQEVVKDAVNFEDESKSKDAKIVYQLTNGQNSTKDIEEYISYSYQWVSNRHQEWAALGIVEKESSQAQYEHISSLDTLGIDYPDIPDLDKSSKEQKENEGSENVEQSTIEGATND